jgi:polyphenol oxidase
MQSGKSESGTDVSTQGSAIHSMRGANSLEIIRVPSWSAVQDPKLAWLVHGFSTRTGGQTAAYRCDGDQGLDLNLGFTVSDRAETVIANRALFCQAVCGGNGDPLPLVTIKQIHSALTRTVSRRAGDGGMGIEPTDSVGFAGPATFKADGLITGTPGLLLGIQTADCLPVLLADKKNHVVAAFHAGWRGTLARIVENGVGRMRMEFGSDPKDLIAAIGPGIGQCCYSVGEEVRNQFESQFTYAEELFREFSDSDPVKKKYPMLFLTARPPGHSNLGPSLHLDLAEANRRQLLAAGLKRSAIHVTGQCTGCQTDRFFSHRNEHGFTGRMLSVIGIRP